MSQMSTLRGGMKQIHKEHGNPGRHCLQLNMNSKKQASFIGNVKVSCFISLALNLHWESAHGAGKQNPPVAKGSSLQSLSCWILL